MTNAYLNRRTFAIISHPDAGKTTLTEKLLYFSGAIRLAGEVKARGDRRRARSDWLAIEQKRGISVTTSAMTFEHAGCLFNLLDTPGHEDFSEDTYRTLTAVDSAVMVIDAAKGIETQTRKLFEVCRLRDIPIMTFVNKVDREGRDPFELIDEIADQLALDVSPQVWPVGTGGEFAGCYDMAHDRLLLDDGGDAGKFGRRLDLSGPGDSRLDEIAGADLARRARDQMELAREGYAPFDLEQYRHGALTPIYFGSALKEFSVAELLRDIGKFAPPPRAQKAGDIAIEPSDNSVSGFVFKVQANMDPNHRDRIAFVRLCSGEFKRGMKLKVSRTEKLLAVNAPIFFLAQERNLAEEAVAGDIIGVPNHGALGVGDTLSEKDGIKFSGLPDFAPEIIRRVRLDDPMKSKQMKRAMTALAEEGAAQVFMPSLGADFYVGVVGALQLDVIEERMKSEYGVAAVMEPCGYDAVRWLSGAEAAVGKFVALHQSAIAHDRYGSPVYLARSAWEAGYAEQKNPDVKFLKTRERV
ncbi:MAG: peptide chain release factor 3 [Alphaproteobacteria bacterium RIFCSPHIGHO2_12_FULL_63_12]|nr:MAG: peptide chain release factor 3 [Alphaproteobacteria bacterium RIFCSPHIGHO2_12_FULL_63_12]